MPSTGTLGGTLPLGPKRLKVKHQTFPHNGSTGLKQPPTLTTPIPQPAHLSQITITGLEPRMQLDVAGKGYLLFPNLLLRRLLLPNLYHFWCYRKNNDRKIHLNTLLMGWTNIFPPVPSGPWLSSPLIGNKFLPAFDILQLLQSR